MASAQAAQAPQVPQAAQEAPGNANANNNNRPENRSGAKRHNPGSGGGGHKGHGGKRAFNKQKKTKRERNITEGSSEEVLQRDIDAVLATSEPTGEEASAADETAVELPTEGTELDVEVVELSSTGDGLAVLPGTASSPSHVFVVPFTVPGDTARVRVYRHVRADRHSHADFLSVVTPSPLRDDARIRCRYFFTCGGCQFQMLDYAEQLRRKQRIVDKAFRNFSNLAPELVPAVRETMGSPLQYGYRTKLTPHFDGPPGFRGGRRGNKGGQQPSFESCPDIGFMQKGRRKVLDIEDCPIGTDAVRRGNKVERERMQREFGNYKRGATLLLRENTKRLPKDSDEIPAELDANTIRVDNEDTVDLKTVTTVSKDTTTEYIGDYVFTNPAGSFFQNNNSILPSFTQYVRDNILPPSNSGKDIRYLIDAYSGSGLFTITLSSLFEHSVGIDIAADSIASAGHNAALNGLGPDRCRFIAADAGELFKGAVGQYDPDHTVVVLDPPRKGCDASFLAQLRAFAPRRVLYVSCNVHTQARDVGVLVRGEGPGARFEIESLRGFDFFPQTGHVEGVAILNRVDEPAAEAAEKPSE